MDFFTQQEKAREKNRTARVLFRHGGPVYHCFDLRRHRRDSLSNDRAITSPLRPGLLLIMAAGTLTS